LQVWPAEGEVFSDLNVKIDASQPVPDKTGWHLQSVSLLLFILGIFSESVGVAAL